MDSGTPPPPAPPPSIDPQAPQDLLDPPPLQWRQRSILLLVFLTAIMLALPFFLIGWGLSQHQQRSEPSAPQTTATSEPISARLNPLREVLEASPVLPPPAPLGVSAPPTRFHEWRPAITAENAAAWEHFVRTSSAIPLGEFTEDGQVWVRYSLPAASVGSAPAEPPSSHQTPWLLVLPGSAGLKKNEP